MDINNIERMAQDIPDDLIISRISTIFQALQSQTRLKIMYLLSRKPMCVCELECTLNVTQSAISHSLKTLRQLDLVRVKKEGRYSIYYIADDHVSSLMDMCHKHARECGK